MANAQLFQVGNDVREVGNDFLPQLPRQHGMIAQPDESPAPQRIPNDAQYSRVCIFSLLFALYLAVFLIFNIFQRKKHH